MQAEFRVSCTLFCLSLSESELAREQHTSPLGYLFVSLTIGWQTSKFKYAHEHDLGRSTAYDATEREKECNWRT